MNNKWPVDLHHDHYLILTMSTYVSKIKIKYSSQWHEKAFSECKKKEEKKVTPMGRLITMVFKMGDLKPNGERSTDTHRNKAGHTLKK